MHQVNHVCQRAYEFVRLFDTHGQRGSDFQHHEIVAADLREHTLVTEQPHYQDLAEHGRMDPGEGLKRQAQTQLARRLELNAREHSDAANVTNHFVIRKPFAQAAAQPVPCSHGALTGSLRLQHVESAKSGPARIASPFSLWVEV
jgi:hypothetical protein